MSTIGSPFQRRSRAAAFGAALLFAQGALADGTGFFTSAQLSQGRFGQ